MSNSERPAPAKTIGCSEMMALSADTFRLFDETAAARYGFHVAQTHTQCKQLEPNQVGGAVAALRYVKPDGMQCEEGEPVTLGDSLSLVNMRCTASDGVLSINVGYESKSGQAVVVANALAKSTPALQR